MSDGWESDEVGARLDAVLARAKSAWPTVQLADAEFVAHVASKVERPSELDALHAADLYLAYACARGDRSALTAFESYLGEVDAAFRRVRVPIGLDEAKQQVRTKLLVADDPESGPRIAQYRGVGDLRAWVRVAATRHLLNVATRLAPDQKATDDALEEIAAAGRDPELSYFRERHGAEFKAAFERAASELSTRERTVLRLALCEHATVDRIGAELGVHRATAARWVAAARDALQKNVRRALRDRCGMNDAEVESAIRVMGSAIDLSVSRVLGSGT